MLLPLLLLLAGCDPCGAWDGTVVEDPDGLDATLRDTLAADLVILLDAFGEGRVCVDRVVLAELSDADSDLVTGTAQVVHVDPDAADPRWQMRVGLCMALDNREQLGTDPTFADPDEFFQHCALGPFDPGWAAQIEAACGESVLSDAQQFMLDRVYLHGDRLVADGVLTTTLGEPATLPDVPRADLGGVAPLGDGVSVLAWKDQTDVEALDLYTVTFDGAASTLLLSLSGATLDAHVFGGPDAGVVYAEVDDEPAIWVVDAATRTVSSVPTAAIGNLFDAVGTVSGGVLYVATGYPSVDPLVVVDLATGAQSEIALPPPLDPVRAMVVNALAAVDDGFVATLTEAAVEATSHSVSVTVYTVITARWSAATGWTELDRSEDFQGALFGFGGSAAHGYVGGSFSGAGSVLAAKDLATGALHVSSDRCVDDIHLPATVAGNTLVDLRNLEPVTLQPIRLVLE
ncbi:MAG: hypothetical protein V4850_25465 [Myxococcota bacterium]